LYLYDLVKKYFVFLDHKFPSNFDDVVSYIMLSLQLVISCDYLGKGESTLQGAILDKKKCTFLGYIFGVVFL
jgi:hypothetical protein